MPRSARLQQLIESLSPTEEAELAEELARRERERARLKAAREFLEEYEAEHGPITEEEIAQVRLEWPRD
jgi:hypothetical protein